MMNFSRTKKYGFGTQLAICFILVAMVFIAVPGITMAQQTASGQTPATQTICSGLRGFVPDCWIYNIVLFTATFFVYLSTWILSLSGMLFNWLVGHTILQFGDLYSTVKPAVEQAWTAFRDIANILIIGMFTFIAISIILGSKEYGQKKLIAKVLIIAVLLNFSLLFAKMVIDASNFVATQFYTAAGLGAVGEAGAGGTSNNAASAGIAGQFEMLLGVGTISQTKASLDQAGSAGNSSLVLLLHAMFMFMIVLGAAVVLFYGSFLLVSRAIMLIFLLVTASIAFASYLIPKWETSSYGWDAWWSSLKWCATLGPILMLSLWVTLNVSSAIHTTARAGSLGDLVANPSNGGNVSALFAYLIILGLLFASFKLSSAWAHKIGGFSWAQTITGTGLGLGGIAGGWLGRNALGWGARTARNAMVNAGWTGKQGNDGLAGTARRQAQIMATRLANRTQRTNFNPLQAKTLGIGAKLASTLSVPKALTGKDVGGSFEDVMKRKALAADEVARQIGPSDAQKQREADTEGRRRFNVQQRQTNTLIKQQQDTHKAIVEQTKQSQPERAGAEDAIKRERDAKARADDEHASKLRIQEQRAATATNPRDRQTAQVEAARLLAARRTAIEGENARIQTAQAKVTQLDDAAKAVADIHPDVVALKAQIEEETKKLDAIGKTEDDAVKNQRSKNEQAFKEALLWDNRAKPNLKGAAEEHQNIANWKAFRATEPGGGGHAAPAPAPAAPAAATPPASSSTTH